MTSYCAVPLGNTIALPAPSTAVEFSPSSMALASVAGSLLQAMLDVTASHADNVKLPVVVPDVPVNARRCTSLPTPFDIVDTPIAGRLTASDIMLALPRPPPNSTSISVDECT